MNSENENYIICDECGGKMMTNIVDQDSRGYIFCSRCGLVHDPEHEMGYGFGGLIDFMRYKKLNSYIEHVTATFKVEGLAKARLMVSKL